MTKEEFLMLHVGAPIPLVNGNRATVHIEKAMDEYAKQQAIAFDVWKRINLYTLDYPNNRYIKLTIIGGDKASTETFPVDEVYSKFIEQQETK